MNNVSNATPKFIYFDLGNVLLTFEHQKACQQLGKLVDRSASDIRSIIFASGLQERYEQGVISSQEIYEEFCGRCGLQRSEWPGYEAFHAANSDIFTLHVPVVGIVVHLQSAGNRLGILSNTCEEHWKHVSGGRFTVLERLFSAVVLSYEERSSKPDLAIYEVAVKRAGVEPGEIFFCDDRQENVDGARRAGLDAVRFVSPQQLASDLRGRGVRFNY